MAAADQQHLGTRAGLCCTTFHLARLQGGTAGTQLAPQPSPSSDGKALENALSDDSLVKTLSCSEDVLMTDFPRDILLYCSFC